MSWRTLFCSLEQRVASSGASSVAASSSMSTIVSCAPSSTPFFVASNPSLTRGFSSISPSSTSSSSSSLPLSSSPVFAVIRSFSSVSSSSTNDSDLNRARELLQGSPPRDREGIPRAMNIHASFSESVNVGDFNELKQMENIAREQFDVDAFRRVGRENLMRAYVEKARERSVEERRDIPFTGDDYHLTEAERRIRWPDLQPPKLPSPNDKKFNMEQLYRLHFRYYLRLRHRLFPKLRRRSPYLKYDALNKRIIRFAKRDELGRSHGKGSRKKARANVWIWPAENENGGGIILVNGKNFAEYFTRLIHREEMTRPFLLSETMGQFNAYIVVKGGGPSGQAGAVKLGVARALQNYDPALRGVLKRAKLLTVDHRNKEPKKPGRTKARRGWQWVKR